VYHLKKLLLTVASIGAFTLNGASRVQLVAVIAFSAGIYATPTGELSTISRNYGT
jgi:hypothetical protein